ncbi:class I SAM-dependent methyltransferase [Actinoplanes sp. N902-109]|uniref:class I SAM-dependent methyltransferase n=1 Tax=Actinoplanes sp. (strain N902-109) TaxID=649831 RepID=UPI000329352D|nr:class I SAM-dependent methyltransferase [Actinoplanes sp. N902-109]AGL17893.1 methyltransferase small domain-containing protein [Actinoplanes sp. N902-109]
MTRDTRSRASYGIDAPALLAIPASAVVAGLWQVVVTRSPWPLIGVVITLLCVGLGVHAARRGKLVVWDELLSFLRGDEDLLDIGCGRGAVLTTAARRLPHGRAVGVDVWRTRDQSGNCADATRRNAALTAVADHVGVDTGTMLDLPYADASFDVVVSMTAVHNVGQDHVDRAIAEAVRVLRPGGRLLIADLRFTRRYAHRLRELGMIDVSRRSLGWRLWWTGPWLRTVLITATRPADDRRDLCHRTAAAHPGAVARPKIRTGGTSPA